MRFSVPPLIFLFLLMFPIEKAYGIYGGRILPKTEGQAIVYFQAFRGRRSSSCSGVLISPTAVLTAAHCVRTPSSRIRRLRSVRVGNPKGKTQRVSVSKVYVHPQFAPPYPERGYDLAVIILKKPIKTHRPIPLATKAEDPRKQGTKIQVFGFGLTEKGRRIVRSKWLRVATLEYLSPFGCFHGPVKKMAKTRICIASLSAGICPGDSGGPAIIKTKRGPVVFGISSITINRRQCSDNQAVVGRVSASRKWIMKVAKIKE